MKKKTSIVLVIILIFYILFSLPCDSDFYCTGPLSGIFSYPALWLLALIPLSVIGFILNDRKYKIWITSSLIYFVISMYLVYISPEYSSDWIFRPDKEGNNLKLLILYSFLSLIFFGVNYFRDRKSIQIKN